MKAFTLVETMITVGIIALLAAIFIFTSPALIAKADAVRCTNNMRQLHTAFNSYIQDKGHWPQPPEDIADDEGTERLEDWYIKELAPFTQDERVWRCPTVTKELRRRSLDRPRIHYMPTMFDGLPQTPYKWPTQPWFIEVGNAHGKGALICFPDGSIKTMDEVLSGLRPPK